MSNKINSPSWYTLGGIEVIDFIDAKRLDYYKATIIKYIVRSGLKPDNDEIDDLKKAKWFLDRKIKLLEESKCRS